MVIIIRRVGKENPNNTIKVSFKKPDNLDHSIPAAFREWSVLVVKKTGYVRNWKTGDA